jgi:K+ transporter
VPWRFLDAGELSVRTVSSLPAVQKSAQIRKQPRIDAMYSRRDHRGLSCSRQPVWHLSKSLFAERLLAMEEARHGTVESQDPGTAIFVARVTRDIPPPVFWHLRHIRSLHDSIFIVTIVTELIPYVAEEKRAEVRHIAPQVWRVHAHYGFMEQPDLLVLLDLARDRGYPVDPSQVTWFIGRETNRETRGWQGPAVVHRDHRLLVRNSSEAADYFRLPRDEVVEIGRQFTI